MCAFLEGALLNSTKSLDLTESSLNWLQFFFSTEGVFYAVAEFFMVGIMANTPPAFGGGARGSMQFAILMAGGIFFALSGLVFPGCITNISLVFSKKVCLIPLAGVNSAFAWNAMAHYGITCFMAGTSIGFHGVLSLPKGKLISPFWGCTFYFLGAWTIGIFKFWGPVLAGGWGEFDSTAPAMTCTWNWWLALLGAFFLATGAGIFLVMNNLQAAS